jgi:hypothetical protein
MMFSRRPGRGTALLERLGIVLAAAVGPGIVLGAVALMIVSSCSSRAAAAAEPAEVDPLGLYPGCRFAVVFFDGSYMLCRDADEAADVFARFPYLADSVRRMGDLDQDPDLCGWFQYHFSRSRPRLTLHIVSAGAEG